VTQTTSINRTDGVRVGIAYLSFIVLGMPGAMLGVAWSPAIRNTFGLSLDAVGALLVAAMGSYFVASFISGRLVARVGFGTLLIASSFLTAVGLIGYVLSPTWAVMVIFGILVGGGGGVIDAGMNIYFAAHYGPRLMNWLHASFGIGATLSPLLMTTILNGGGVWRTGYIVLAAAFGLIGVLFGLTRGSWNDSKLLSANNDAARAGFSARQTLRLPLAWIGIGLFFLYGGQETTPGQWSYSLFTDARHVAADVAGLWVSIYWASFTVGRIVFGFIVSWLSARTLLNICAAGSVVGAILLWWRPVVEAGFSTTGTNLALQNPTNTVGFIGLALFGFTLAPMFALLITSTQERLGPQHAPNAIGFQVAAASIGAGLLPGLAGKLAVDHGLEIVPLFLLVMTAVAMVLYIASTRPVLSVHRQPVLAGD
jgi:fucose permease